MPITTGIGNKPVELIREPVRLEMDQVKFNDLQAEVAKSRVLQAAYEHINSLDLAAIDISFGLNFGLTL